MGQPPIDLSGVRMRTRHTAASGVVSSETVLSFEHEGEVVSAAYRGGRVLAGYLVGRLAGQDLRFRYVQTDVDGALDAGVSDGVVDRLPDGRYRLTEHFQWTTRPESGTNVFEEVGAEGERAMASISNETAARRGARAMKAIRVHEFGGPERMQLEEVESPRPGPGQVLVELRAVGVNPVDTYILSGAHSVKPSLPYTPGRDGAGVVLEAAPDAGFSAGDRVYLAGSVTGTYADRALALAEQVHRLPAAVSFAQGAALGVPYATAYRALFQLARATAGESVLVHGASGGVGVATVQLARAAGLTVIGTGGSERSRQLVIQQGAHHALDHEGPDLAAQVQALTSGRGVDVILEMKAHTNLAMDFPLLAQRGRVVVIGSRGRIEIDPRAAMVKDASILTMVLFNATAAELASVHAGLVAALEGGWARPVVAQELPLADAAEAHRALERGPHGKIVLVP